MYLKITIGVILRIDYIPSQSWVIVTKLLLPNLGNNQNYELKKLYLDKK